MGKNQWQAIHVHQMFIQPLEKENTFLYRAFKSSSAGLAMVINSKVVNNTQRAELGC